MKRASKNCFKLLFSPFVEITIVRCFFVVVYSFSGLEKISNYSTKVDGKTAKRHEPGVKVAIVNN